jgi:Mg/Co/Ni transporter MgtE
MIVVDCWIWARQITFGLLTLSLVLARASREMVKGATVGCLLGYITALVSFCEGLAEV